MREMQNNDDIHTKDKCTHRCAECFWEKLWKEFSFIKMYFLYSFKSQIAKLGFIRCCIITNESWENIVLSSQNLWTTKLVLKYCILTWLIITFPCLFMQKTKAVWSFFSPHEAFKINSDLGRQCYWPPNRNGLASESSEFLVGG